MSDKWMIRAITFANCNCEINCGCQFNVPTTHGYCNFLMGGLIEEGNFNGTSLDGLKYAIIFAFPGEIAEGNGRQLIVIDENADEAQRQAIQEIVSGSAGEPGATHFAVFSSMCTQFPETQFKQIEIEVDIESRKAHLNIPGLVTAVGKPAINEFNGELFHIAIARPTGSFEYTYAELGRGTATVTGPIEMQLDESYAQFCTIHYDQDGLVRAA